MSTSDHRENMEVIKVESDHSDEKSLHPSEGFRHQSELSYRSMKSSSASAIEAGAAAKAAEIRTKLQYSEVEDELEQQQMKLRRKQKQVTLQKELDIANAQIAAIRAHSEPTPSATKAHLHSLPTETRTVERYLEQHVAKQKPAAHVPSPPGPIDVDTPNPHVNIHMPTTPAHVNIDVPTTPALVNINMPTAHTSAEMPTTHTSADMSTRQLNIPNPAVLPSQYHYEQCAQLLENDHAKIGYQPSQHQDQQFLGNDRSKIGYQPSQHQQAQLNDQHATPGHYNTASPPGQTVTDLHYLGRVISEQCSQRLPPPEPCVFNGNPLEYNLWKRSFDLLVEHKNLQPSEKLYYLQRYLSGKAKECIHGFLLESADGSYTEARARLEERFGNPFYIAASFKKKLRDWPKVPDGPALQRFADFLKQCESAKRSNVSLNILDDADMNKMMLDKLPHGVIKSWSRVVYHYKQLTRAFPPFGQFVNFVGEEALIATDPVIAEALKREAPNSRQTKGNAHQEKRQSFAANRDDERTGSKAKQSEANSQSKDVTATASSKRPCFSCKGDHHLDNCTEFLKLSLEERREYAKTNKLCFACLNQKHIAKDCKYKKWCKICRKRHPTSLHYEKWGEEEESRVGHLASNVSRSNKCTMVVPVYVSQGTEAKNEVLVYALLDTQSDTTFVTTSLCNKLGVSGVETHLRLSTLSTQNEVINCNKVQGLQIRGYNTSKAIPIGTAFTRATIPANRDHIPSPDTISRLPHLRKVADELMPRSDCEIGLLIGYDCPRAFTPREVVMAPDHEAFAQRTDLGWGVMGILDCSSFEYSHGVTHKIIAKEIETPLDKRHTVSFSVKATKPKEIINPDQLNNLIDREFATSLDTHDPKRSIEDQKFLRTLNEGIKKTPDGHFEMPLPFRDSHPIFPNNRTMAEKRLQGLKRKLTRDQDYREDYCKFMENLMEKGYAERCDETADETASQRYWYIPHHGVYHPKKRKLRVVFDASAKHAGISLNDTLLQGPDLINGLLGVLCRFRKESVAIMCDIEQMFYQFRVVSEHRDYLRFLWWEDFNQPPVEFRMTVHLFGAESSPGCANFGLKMAAECGKKEFGKAAADFVRHDFYVDDGLTSVATVKEGRTLVEDVQNLCANSGLHLHKFVSNEAEVLEAVPEPDRAIEVQHLDLLKGCEVTERTLGIEWSVSNDSFQFKVALKNGPPSRRGILSSVSSVYDPLGFLAPVILGGRIILQEICKQGLDWDAPLPKTIVDRWDSWKKELVELESFKVPRLYKPANFGKLLTVELHHFSDASTVGYGQCTYLRLIDCNNNVHCSLVMSKSRVAPVKQITIPRLELSAAALSVKVSNFLKRELKYDKVEEYFWTDSTVVLGYIHTDAKRFQVFVANRVQQIRDSTDPKQWNHVNSENNPSDCVSRGLTAQQLIQTDSWLKGPMFLRSNVLPSSPHNPEVQEGDPELKKVHSFATTAKAPADMQEHWARFSSWQRLRKAVAHCLRYKRLLHQRVKIKHGEKIERLNAEMNVELLLESEREIIKSVQREALPAEMKHLQEGKNSSVREKGSTYKLDPFLDGDGILRVGGRLEQSLLSPELKHPIILPKNNHVSALIVQHIHGKSHQGRGSTLNAIRRSGYWIIGCKAMVSRTIHECWTCRKYRGRLQHQKMAPLPADRTENVPPFTYCGVDYFGPFLIRIKRSDVPRYGALFTCLTSRAIHLEVAESLNTDSFINALRRVIAIRGPIRQLRSDCGTNFVGAKNVLEKELNSMNESKVKDYLLGENCDYVKFKMNTPSASHMGGVWERQIRTVRSILQPMLDKIGTQLDDELLRTVFYEVMAIVNSRPLSIDNLHDPFSEVLSPNQLLTMKSTVVLPPPGNFVSQDLYATRRWRRAQYVLNLFWSKWQAEYLSELQNRQKWTHPQRNMAIGDIVMLKEDESPRNTWPIAIVQDAYPSQDGRVRKLKVRVADHHMNNRGKRTKAQTILERPVHKCVLLHRGNSTDEEPLDLLD